MKSRVLKAGLWIGGGLLALGLAGLAFQQIMNILNDRWPAPGDEHDLDDVTLHLSCEGEASPTVLLEAGAGSWSIHWVHIQEQLSAHVRTCVYDRAGHGWSGDTEAPASGKQMATRLHALLNAAGETGPLVFAGHSLGGYIARIYQDTFPDQVAGVVLIDAAHPEQWERQPPEVRALVERLVNIGGTAAVMARFGLLRLMGSENPQDLPGAREQAILAEAVRRARYYRTFAAEFDAGLNIAGEVQKLEADLGQLPLTVITAGRSAWSYCGPDIGVPCEDTQRTWAELQGELAELSGDSRHVTSPEAQHDIHLDDPRLVIEEIRALVEKVRLKAGIKTQKIAN